MGIPVSLTVAPDGSYLYLITRHGLIVFSRDASSGRLGLAREIVRDGDPESPFYKMSDFKDVALDAQGAMLFVSGENSEQAPVFDAAVAAFDVSTDPSNPVHLDTLTNLYFETDLDASRAWNHLKPARNTFRNCNDLVPHGVFHAVDVFCRGGYYVVRWNPETQALEVTDFAASGADDRFGNTVPSLPSQDSNFHSNFRPRQMTQSPDGAHVYRSTSVAEYAQTDAIHFFERASAMKPVEGDEDTGGAVSGTTTYGVDDALPDNGEVDRFPTFRTAVSPGDQTYTVGTAIEPLPLPEASSGNAPLSYSLTPSVPGLTFNATARQLTGTPSTAGTYAMTYTVADDDGDTDALSFTITVNSDSSVPVMAGDCYVGLLVRPGESCTYPGAMDEFSVNERGRGSFLGRLAGIRIRINNQTINGRVYDFEASHQGDGVWRIDRVANST